MSAKDRLLEAQQNLLSTYEAYNNARDHAHLQEFVDLGKAKKKIVELNDEVKTFRLLMSEDQEGSAEVPHRNQPVRQPACDNPKNNPTPGRSKKAVESVTCAREEEEQLARFLASDEGRRIWKGKLSINWTLFAKKNPKRSNKEWREWYTGPATRMERIEKLVARYRQKNTLPS